MRRTKTHFATTKGQTIMHEYLNTQTLKAQGTKFVYLPNSSRLHKPLLGIKRIDNQWTCLFYLSAWELLPDRYNVKKSKRHNQNEVLKMRKKFFATAKKSGVTVGRGAKVTSLLQSIQSLGVV